MSLDIQQLLTDNLISIITTLFGGGSFYAYYVERGKRKIEAKQLGADALKSMQDAYDKFTEDSLKRYEDLKNEVQDLRTNLNLERENNEVLRKEHDSLKIAYNKLKKDFDDYKKKYK